VTPTASYEGRSRRRRWLLALGVLILAGVGGSLFGLHRWTRHQRRTAEDLLADLRFEEAGRMLDDYLRIHPSDAEAHLLAAGAKRRAGDPEAAEYHLNEFDRRHGQTPASSLERVLLLAERGALGNKEFWLRARLEKGNADPIVLLEALTRNYQSVGRLDDALLCLGDLLKERPFHPRALAWRAQIWLRLEKWGDAVEDAGRAVEVRPDSLEARLVWAQANERVGQADKAVREYGWLYQRGQKSPNVVLGLGRCSQDLGRFAEARQVLDAFLAEQPERADVLVERGRLALREGETTPAETYFRRAVVADPNNLDANRFLLRCLEETGGNAEESARVDGRLRQLEIRDGRIAQLRSEVLAAPNKTEPRYRIGMLMLQSGREEGMEWLASVLNLDPRHEPARAALAAYYQRTGRGPGEGGEQ
jgi:tetratricopeptide (TPR) repeat protein